MGHFAVPCSLSGLPIREGCRAVFGYVSASEMGFGYCARAPFVRGVYDGYGRFKPDNPTHPAIVAAIATLREFWPVGAEVAELDNGACLEVTWACDIRREFDYRASVLSSLPPERQPPTADSVKAALPEMLRHVVTVVQREVGYVTVTPNLNALGCYDATAREVVESFATHARFVAVITGGASHYPVVRVFSRFVEGTGSIFFPEDFPDETTRVYASIVREDLWDELAGKVTVSEALKAVPSIPMSRRETMELLHRANELPGSMARFVKPEPSQVDVELYAVAHVETMRVQQAGAPCGRYLMPGCNGIAQDGDYDADKRFVDAMATVLDNDRHEEDDDG